MINTLHAFKPANLDHAALEEEETVGVDVLRRYNREEALRRE